MPQQTTFPLMRLGFVTKTLTTLLAFNDEAFLTDPKPQIFETPKNPHFTWFSLPPKGPRYLEVNPK